MSKMSDWLEVELRKHIFRTGSMTKPSVLAVALHTADPGDTGAGAEVTNANNYARVNVSPADANWSGASPTDGLTDNVNAITFNPPTGSWGVVTHFGIWDSASHGAGNLVCYGNLAANKTINGGDPAPSFAAGALDITFA